MFLSFHAEERSSVNHHYQKSWPTKIERDVIERAPALDFLPEARNLIRRHQRKTMTAQNICHQAVLATPCCSDAQAALLEELHRPAPEGRLRNLRTYANLGLPCIDEVGYLSFDDRSANDPGALRNRNWIVLADPAIAHQHRVPSEGIIDHAVGR
jgi:hypothetical protein